ncbi:hypothetical protein SAY87_023967 [Trapa incisa]|uniref:Uncharacterized protein n=1 Tax=Trapa incisa TaxID=236973 RepID=A0AAN7KZH7_9MYRT|nr:hypothetical protein SAY87_023967 [Trapa incisa]
MEKLMRPCDKESMRMAMIKHEETFKEQVHELHRLYQIQKLLMKKRGSALPNGGATLNLAGQIDSTDFKPREGVDPQRLSGYSSDGSKGISSALDTIEESQIELTLGPSSYTTSTSRSDKGETRLTSSSLSSSTGSSDNIITSNIMGSFTGRALVKEEQFLKSERLNHPPWSFQVLSLNST